MGTVISCETRFVEEVGIAGHGYDRCHTWITHGRPQAFRYLRKPGSVSQIFSLVNERHALATVQGRIDFGHRLAAFNEGFEIVLSPAHGERRVAAVGMAGHRNVLQIDLTRQLCIRSGQLFREVQRPPDVERPVNRCGR